MKKIVFVLFIVLSFLACKTDDDSQTDDSQIYTPQLYNILSLGDSYTIGESVCETCRFPEQLKDSLLLNFPSEDIFSLKVIAQTGWTTTNLISAIENENLTNTYNLVTLLIGVNNQFQGRPFSLYEEEFPELVNTAIMLAKGNANNVIVVSIPDYSYTPFGQNFGNPATTPEEIDMYNAFAENYCNTNNISFVNITDITRQGLDNPNLVASDGLHPSELAYSRFVERILPVALTKIQ